MVSGDVGGGGSVTFAENYSLLGQPDSALIKFYLN